MKKICPYQNVTYIGWDEVKVENCPIEEHYTGESSICCYDKDYKNCPTYNLQKENDNLNSILTELEKYIKDTLNKTTMHIYHMNTYNDILNKIQELKGKYNENNTQTK